ncbi:MAG TPA: hypothetical protein VFN55_08670 [Solirubrobacteraceae bacterium]|nr:hypothetical protein [Solirubrobacteraceae bacterium]
MSQWLAAAVLGLAAASASAAGADRRPIPPVFRDRVIRNLEGAQGAVAAAAATTLRTADGYRIRVVVSPAYRPRRATEQAYVDFLGSLLHGRELGQLGGLYIETPREVVSACGAGALACYVVDRQIMIVPGRPPFPGAPVTYVIAHEYAHHIAAHRRNALGSAELLGPERWSAYEHVCQGVVSGVLKPGAEAGPAYFENPGEAWAEAYAQLRFPHTEPWRFDRRLAPTRPGAAAAIRAAVLHPWDGARRRGRVRIRLGAGAAAAARLRLPMAIGGAVRVGVRAPHGLRYRLAIRAGRQRLATVVARGRRRLSLVQCAAGVNVSATVTRLSGAGTARLDLEVPAA